MSLLNFNKTKQESSGEKVVDGHTIVSTPSYTKQDLEQEKWTVDKFVQDGQINPLSKEQVEYNEKNGII
jgi:hypothetical protein